MKQIIKCQDALEGLKEVQDESIHLVVTDPPYPISRDNGTGRLLHQHPQEKEWFTEGYEDWNGFFSSILSEFKRVLVQGAHVYVFVNETNLWTIKPMMDEHFTFKSLLVWHKGSKPGEAYGMGYHYRKSCEYVLFYTKGKSRKHVTDHGTLLQYPRNAYKVDHPTPKPVSLCRLFIEKSTEQGETVLDPFLGSGSTAVAAYQAKRGIIGFEIDQKYVDLSMRRLKQKTLVTL